MSKRTSSEIEQLFRPFSAVIFDAGGVLLDWNREEILRKFGVREEEVSMVLDATYAHDDWLQHDGGTLSYEQLLKNISQRLKWSIADSARFIDHSWRALLPLPESIELLEELRRLGKKTYLLSNMPEHAYNFFSQRDSFWKGFDGEVVSYRLKLLKPHAEIYRETKALIKVPAQQALFLDDREDNVAGAKAEGLNALVFTTVSKLCSDLANLRN